MSSVSMDTSELDRLVADLERAAARPTKDRGRVLLETANKIADDARSGAPVDSGELRSSIYVQGSALTKVVGSDVRQAWFLEAGSPSTGAPRPWLTGPAERNIDLLLEKLGKLGEIF